MHNRHIMPNRPKAKGGWRQQAKKKNGGRRVVLRFPPPVVWGVVAAAGKGPLFYLSVIHFALFALRCAPGGQRAAGRVILLSCRSGSRSL